MSSVYSLAVPFGGVLCSAARKVYPLKLVCRYELSADGTLLPSRINVRLAGAGGVAVDEPGAVGTGGAGGVAVPEAGGVAVPEPGPVAVPDVGLPGLGGAGGVAVPEAGGVAVPATVAVPDTGAPGPAGGAGVTVAPLASRCSVVGWLLLNSFTSYCVTPSWTCSSVQP